MPDTFTTNFSWTKPGIGESANSWGTKLNTNLDGIDSTVKSVKNVTDRFPNVSGTVSSDQAELNKLDGCTATTADLNLLTGKAAAGESLPFPSGTKMVFFQVNPPTGWTPDTNADGCSLFVKGTFNGSARAGGFYWTGGHDPSVNDTVPTHTHSWSGSTGNNGGHTHTAYGGTGSTTNDCMAAQNAQSRGFAGSREATGLAYFSTFPTGGSAPLNTVSDHSHSVSGTNANNAGAAVWYPKFACVCVGTKT